MARIRSIKPEITSDRKLAQVSLEARLTFIYTWTIADDDGFFRAEERQLLGALFPHDSRVTRETLDHWLGELVSLGVLRWRTTLDGSRVGEIVNWRKHQKIDRPSTSHISKELQPLTTRDRAQTREPVAKRSRAPRETLDAGVLSPDLGPSSRAPRESDHDGGKPAVSGPRETWISPYWDVWRRILGGDPPKAILRWFEALQKSAEWQDGTLLRRWTNFVTGLKAKPTYLGKPAAQVEKFTSTHALYDDPQWYMGDRERAEFARETDGLFG